MQTTSAIIPVYNCLDYLENCTASILAVNENCRDPLVKEIILVDDGSTDGSSELCDRISNDNLNNVCSVKVIHQENKGVSAARNKGLSIAEGTFVLFADCDDSLDSQKLAELLQSIDSDTNMDMAVFGMSFDYYSGKRIYRTDLMLPGFEGKLRSEEFKVILPELFASNMLSSICNRLVRRRVIEDASLRLREDMFLYEDLEFSLRVIEQCKTIAFYREAIYHYRQSSDEGNAVRRLQRIEHIPQLVDKIEDALVPLTSPSKIILPLYMTLAREKISAASKAGIRTVCGDFKEWIDKHELKNEIESSAQAMSYYNGNVNRIILRRMKSKVRHRTANWVKKNFGDFRKRK